MRRVLIIQARMGSVRLPGKVLMDIGGQSMLARVVRRAGRAALQDAVVVATSLLRQDDAVAEHARALGVGVFRGDADDVLDRYYRAAQACGAEAVVRITADCPLIEPEIIDRVIAAFDGASPRVDFASNVLQRTYPRGLDVEVASFDALAQAWRDASQPYQRAHVFPYLYQDPARFKLVSVTDAQDHSACRWTVDTADDLAFMRAVYQRLGGDGTASWREVLALLDLEPALLAINRHVQQKTLQEG